MDFRARHQLNKGYADTLSRGFEFAMVPVVFGGMGWLLDRTLGTKPVFTIGLVVFGFIGMIIKMWIGYDAAMKAEEADAPWNRNKTDKTDKSDAAEKSTVTLGSGRAS